MAAEEERWAAAGGSGGRTQPWTNRSEPWRRFSSAAGLDQLKHLGTKTTRPSLAVQGLEDQTGCRIGLAAFSGISGLVVQTCRTLQQQLPLVRLGGSTGAGGLA